MKQQGKVLVMGSTGTIGSMLVSGLVEAGVPVRAATREPSTAAKRAGFPPEVEVVELDLERESTFDPALDGVERVFMSARPGDEESDRFAFPLIDAMERKEVRCVVDLSALGAEQRPDFALRKVETRLEASSLAWTHLRPNWFMQVFTAGSLLASIRMLHAIRIPAALAKISWVDGRDIAAVAARVLIEGEKHAGKAYALTGGAALDHSEIASLISGATGLTVRYEPINEDEAREALKKGGFPDAWVERLIIFYRLVRAGLASPVSPSIQEVLGSPPHSFASFASTYSSVWRS